MKGKTKLTLSAMIIVFSILSIATFLPVLAQDVPTTFCTTTGSYNVCTDQEDYTPASIVHIAGSGFAADSNLLVKVTRPDGSAVAGDGSFAPWPTPYDEITADSSGAFQYDYILNGIGGTYSIEILDSSNIVLATHTFTDVDIGCSPNPTTVGTSVTCTANGVGSAHRPAHIKWYDGASALQFSDACDSGTCDSIHSPGSAGSWTVKLVKDSDSSVRANTSLTVSAATGTLVVKKHVVNDNGGTTAASSFNLYVKSGGSDVTGSPAAGSESGTTYTLTPGAYVVSEDSPPTGYSQTGFSGDCNSNGEVTVVSGQTKTCTITNDDIAPQLTVIKHVINDNGGTVAAGSFTIHINGTSVSSNDFAGAESPGTTVTLNAGAYAIGEIGPAGYTQSNSADCSGTIAVGQSKTCTITNDDKAAHLIVIKHVVNDNDGTALASDFTMTINGVTASGGNSFAGAESPGVDKTLTTVGAYSVTETGPAGYSQSASADCSGTIALGETKTCTITNDDIAPKLTVVKVVDNGETGATYQSSDFTMKVDGTDVTQSQSYTYTIGNHAVTETGPSGYTTTYSSDCPEGSVSLALGDDKTCTVTNTAIAPKLTVNKDVINNNGGQKTAAQFTLKVDGGQVQNGAQNTYTVGSHTVSEVADPGYVATFSGACDSNGQVTLGLGDDKTCTITNDDIAPKLTLVKTVTNDDGGDKKVSDFPLFIDGVPATSGTAYEVKANKQITATEDALPGYAASAWGGACSADGTITLLPGDDKTCTITNDDIAPKLTVIKHVIKDNGGNEVAGDFQITVTGTNVQPSSTFSGDESGTTVTLDQGSYSVDETELPGYTKSIGQDCSGTINVGEEKTCTITNDDQPAQITLTKVVNNDYGGNAVPDDFDLTIDQNVVLSGSTTDVSSNSPHAIDETVLSGYEFVSMTGDAKCPSVLGGTATLDEGEHISCTITNKDKPAKITLIKDVVNDDGGNAAANDFGLTVDSTSLNSGDTVEVDSNTLHTIDEAGLTGYNFVSITGDGCPAQLGGTVNLNEGQEITCTITNDDIAPTITLIKKVDSNHGGNAGVNDFGLTIGGTPVNSGQVLTVDANTLYALNEAGLSGYEFVSLTGKGCPAQLGGTVTLNEGQDIICTIENQDLPAKITLTKVVQSNHGGNAVPDDFDPTIDGNVVLSGSTTEVDSNTLHTIDETVIPGYEFVSITGNQLCPAVLGGSVTLDEGQEISCTITNRDLPAHIILNKEIINDNGGNAQPNDFGIKIDGNVVQSGSNTEVDSNTVHTIDETGLSGYDFKEITGDQLCPAVLGGQVTLNEGQTIECTIVNDDQPAHITLIKEVTNNNGGTAGADDFGISIDGTPVTSGSTTDVNSNTGHTIDETGLAGYQFVSITGDAKCPSVLGGSVTLNEGESITCTITNDDIQPKLTVTKVVVNNDGGTKTVENFPLFVDSTSVTSGAQNGFNVGTYTVSETTDPGYTSAISGDCATDGKITLHEGDVKSCTITNDDKPPKALKQDVLNDLIALRAGVTDKHDGKKLDNIIKDVQKSLDDKLWLDPSHLNTKKGKKVFEEEQQAVENLRQLIKDKKSKIPDADLQNFIDRLVSIDRILAVIVIDDAVAEGGDQKDIDKANKELAKGDEEASKGKFAHAIEHYRHAWDKALKSLK